MSDGVERWSVYIHDATGGEYVVMGTARNPNTLKLIVVYATRGQEGDDFHWRPLQEFRTKFTRKKI